VPELPEVEVVRRGLARWVAGREVHTVEVRHPRAVRRHVAGPEDFAHRLVGRVLGTARRRGKYAWLPVDDTDALLVHLGMSGQLLVAAPGTPDEEHLRVRLRFRDDGAELRFVDQRTFGGLLVSEDGAHLPAEIAHLGRDPLDPDYDQPVAVAALRRRRTGLKRALLDQTVVSGIGNIYADEALWRARLHYARATDGLRATELHRVLDAARAVMLDALDAGGTSFDRLYVNVNGQSGWFDRSLEAYGQDGLPCSRCGTAIRREPFMNRSSYRCPRCQPRPRQPRW
jgi:formamidopyrimidine-DNA glycosylase